VSRLTENASKNTIQLYFEAYKKNYLQVTIFKIDVDFGVELIFKFECVVDTFESSSPLITRWICSLLM
jgi:hypothetical protein